VWQSACVTQLLRRHKQEDLEFKTSMGKAGKTYLKNKNENQKIGV
jgi:hypothetical protein